MSERTDAIKLARRLLDEPNADPDDDLRMLSRQLLRSHETIDRMHAQLREVDWEGKAQLDLIRSNQDAILDMHKEAVRRVRRVLEGNKPGRRDTALDVLDALGQFHPMHGESWQGWPKESD